MTVGCSYLKTLQSTICAKANDGIDMIMMQMFSEHDFGCGVSIKETQNHAMFRECVSTDAAGAHTRRSLGHHLLHPLILRLLVLSVPDDFEAQSSLL